MTINRILPFGSSLIIHQTRPATDCEKAAKIKQGLHPQEVLQPIIVGKLAVIVNEEDAAISLFKLADDCPEIGNKINGHVRSHISNSKEFNSWRNYMPSSTPKPLLDYKHEYPLDDYTLVSQCLEEKGIAIPKGQKLFHCGEWPSCTSHLTLSRPFSTTFCPNVALLNCRHNGKAYRAGRVDLFVLTVESCKAKAFVYDVMQGDLAHELEVLFTSGLTLTHNHCQKVENSFEVATVDDDHNTLRKNVPVYVRDIVIG